MEQLSLCTKPRLNQYTSLSLAISCILGAGYLHAESLNTSTTSMDQTLPPAVDAHVVPTVNMPAPVTQTLATLTFQAQPEQPKDADISAVAKTIVTREEMEKYGDQSVNDALRRAAGFQMPSPGQGPRGGGGASSMRFRGGGAPVFLINGEPVQGGPRGGMSVIDTLTPDMIERIEITKQPSVAQASVASSAVINIILKQPLDNARLTGTVKLGYGIAQSDLNEEERKNIILQMDGRDNAWLYSLSANQSWNDTTSVSTTQSQNNPAGISQKRVIERQSSMLTPRVEYEIDDQQKLVGELFYRNHKTDGVRGDQIQHDKNDSIRLNTRYERQNKGDSDKVRLSFENQDETQLTRSRRDQLYTDENVQEYAVAYDGVRKFGSSKQIKFGTDLRGNALESNVAATLDEQRYALYAEGSWRFSDRQTVTLGARQQWINRSGLVDYSDQDLSPVLAHRFDFNNAWSLQTNLSRAFKSPNTNALMPTVTVSTDLDAGSLNNPDRTGNANLRSEKITAYESALGYNTSAGGVNITGFYREIDDYIEKVIRLDAPTNRYIERPINQDNATTYGVEVSARYALKQTEHGHSMMVNAQLSTVRAEVEEHNHQKRLVNDVAPYSASTGLSYNYQPWKLSTSLNLNYVPEFTRALDNQPYDRRTNQRFNVDLSATKRFKDGWATSINARNILSTDYKERLTDQDTGELFQARTNQSIPSLMMTLEKKF